MNDDNKVNSVDENNCEQPVESSDRKAAEELAERLEKLRSTFQDTYDETLAEAQDGPVIQELEEPVNEEGLEKDKETEQIAETTTKKPKKKKRGKIAAIVIAVVLCFAVIVPLLLFFIFSISQPNFSAFISVYSKAISAENYDERMKYFQEALEYCKGDSKAQKATSSVILEQLVVDTYAEKDYISAYSFMTQMMSEEQIANPSSKKFKNFLKIGKSIKELSNKAFAQIFENVGEAKEVPEDTLLTAQLEIPFETADNVKRALTSIAEGYIFDKSANSIKDYLTAVDYYKSAYSDLVSLGADSVALAENIYVSLYNNGFIFEAVLFGASSLKDDAESANADFLAVKEKILSLSDFPANVYELALKADEDEKTTESDVLALVKEKSSFDDSLNEVIADIVVYTREAIKAEKENNLTKASSIYTQLSSILSSFKMSNFSINLKCIETLFRSGNLPDAQELAKEYITDEGKSNATEEQKKFIDEAELTFAALSKTTEVFSPYIEEFYQAHTPVDFDAASKDLDALITEESNKYDKAFVNYCKYFAALYSKENENGKKPDTFLYVTEMAKLIPEQPFIYGALMLDEYINREDYSSAVSTANLMLTINKADEYTNGILAFIHRVNGDVDASLETALKGMELSGEKKFCARHAAIAYMLKGDFESAFGYLKDLYTSLMSIESCDLMLIFNHLYKGEDENILNALKEIIPEIEDTYGQYSIKSYKATLEILDDTKSLQDVFLSGNYDIIEQD